MTILSRGALFLFFCIALPASAQLAATITSTTNVSCNGGCNGAATVTATGGTSPYAYAWAPSGGTGATASGLCAGTYTVTVTDSAAAQTTAVATITQPSAIVVNPVSQTNVSCFGGSNGAAQVSASGGAGGFTYNWTPGNPPGDGTTSVTGLTAQVYTVTVTDANGCTATRTFNITQPASPVSGTTVVTNVSCFGGSNGAINLTPTGGAGGYTYNWLPSGPTTQDRTGLVAGTYTVQITDANGCTGTVTASVTQPTSPVSATTVVTNVSCFGGTSGAINVTPNGGTGPYTYNWLPSGPTTEDRTGLVAGTYSVQITDSNGCTGTVTATVTQPATPVNGTTVVTNVSCFGGSNGAINLTPNGGTGPYTYTWLPSGPTTEDRTGLVAGTYTVQITDVNGCTRTVTATVTQPTSPVSATTVVTNVACFGGSNGAINLTPTGGTGPYTYNWLPSGPTTEDRTGLITGTYTVQITDVNGCTGTVTATVTQPASFVNGTTVVTNVSCFGGSNGAINLTPNGGTGPYTYNWLPSGPTTEDRTGLIAGTYTVQITDVNGCARTVTATVTQPASPVSATTVVTNVACFGGTNGAINVTPSGGTGPYTYNWLPSGPTTEDRTGLAAGTYTVQITDMNGCTGTVTATVTQPATPLSGTTVVTNVSCFGGSNGAINLTPSGGTGPYTFNWLPGGPTTEDRTGLTAGTYTVQITDVNGCTGTVTATVTQPASPVSANTVVTNVACFGGSNGAINLTPNGGTGPYTFNWLPGGPTTEDRTGLTAGTYTVQITDANGCTGTVTATVTQPASPVSATTVVTNVSCFGGSNGAINLTPSGGTGPYTFNWLPGGPTTEDRTGLTAGTYTVQITDVNGCTGTVTATVTQPASPVSANTVVTNVSCFGGSNGAINLTPSGGTGPYTFNWLPGGPTSEDRTGLTAGTYTVQITDANGCALTVTATVTQPASPVSGTTVVTNVACFGGSNGTINLTPGGGTGPYTYNWGGGITTEDRTGLAAGSYMVLVTDANGCTGTVTTTVTEPPLLSATTVVTSVSCNGGSNGAIDLIPAGGTAPYTFNWGGGITTEDRTGLSAGTYTVLVTDANGCTTTGAATLGEPSALTATASQTNVSCFGGSNGSIDLTAAGGTPAYTYDWGGGITTEDRTGLAAGTYTVNVTDANGCTATRSYTITEPPALTTSGAQTNASCAASSDGTATVVASGGTGGYTYGWAPSGGTAATATGLAAGTYTVTVTDGNGCVATRTYTITAPTQLTSTGTQTNVSCAGAANGSATVTASGGTGSYAYSWAPSGGNAATASGLAPGTYTVTITDIASCTTTRTFTITEPATLATTTSATNVSCNGGSNGAANVVVSGGTGPYTYLWAPSGGAASSATSLPAGTYTVTVTDANGCTIAPTVTITQPPALTTTGSQTNVSCFGVSDGTATVTASGGTGPFSYLWAPSGGTAATATGLAAGTYTVTVTDANGCAATRTYTITQPAVLQANGSSTPLIATGTCTGTATVAPRGGAGPYSIVWSPGGATTTTATGLCGPTATATITDANGCTITYTATIAGPTADLSITLSDAPDPAQAGGSIVYTITASSTDPAPNVVVSGSVPAGTTFQSLTAPSGWACTTPAAGGTGNYSCSTATLAATSPATFTLQVGVPALFGPGSVTATAAISGAVIETVTANNSASETTTIFSPARLVAVKTVAPPTSPTGLTYLIVITNNGPAAQVDDPLSHEMTDTLPIQLVLSSATASRGVVTTTGNTVNWNGSLAAGESATVTINATIAPAVAPGTAISNQATIFYDANGDGSNDTTEGSRPSAASAPGPTLAQALATIPTVDPRVLLAMMAGLAAVALLRIRG